MCQIIKIKSDVVKNFGTWINTYFSTEVLGERARVRVSTCYLQEVDVWVNHGVTEVRLDISHGLTFNLQPISHPHITMDLRQASLHKNTHTDQHMGPVCSSHTVALAS